MGKHRLIILLVAISIILAGCKPAGSTKPTSSNPASDQAGISVDGTPIPTAQPSLITGKWIRAVYKGTSNGNGFELDLEKIFLVPKCVDHPYTILNNIMPASTDGCGLGMSMDTEYRITDDADGKTLRYAANTLPMDYIDKVGVLLVWTDLIRYSTDSDHTYNAEVYVRAEMAQRYQQLTPIPTATTLRIKGEMTDTPTPTPTQITKLDNSFLVGTWRAIKIKDGKYNGVTSAGGMTWRFSETKYAKYVEPTDEYYLTVLPSGDTIIYNVMSHWYFTYLYPVSMEAVDGGKANVDIIKIETSYYARIDENGNAISLSATATTTPATETKITPTPDNSTTASATETLSENTLSESILTGGKLVLTFDPKKWKFVAESINGKGLLLYPNAHIESGTCQVSFARFKASESEYDPDQTDLAIGSNVFDTNYFDDATISRHVLYYYPRKVGDTDLPAMTEDVPFIFATSPIGKWTSNCRNIVRDLLETLQIVDSNAG